MKHDKYQILAEQLANVISIGNEAIRKFPPKNWNDTHIELVTKNREKIRQNILNPKPEHRNISSLKYDINPIFTLFQEGGGEYVEYFWSKIKEEDLPFKRENKMVKILKRKKINNPAEYDFVIDTIVPYQQEGFINEEDVKLLNEMIDTYEQKHKQ